MKLTTKKAQKGLEAFKNGLSIVLAFILLGNAVQPLQVLAAAQDGSAEAISASEIEKPVETVQSTLLRVCTANEEITDKETCAKHLFGMVMTESRGIATATGDYGHAHGWFQINNLYNKVNLKCAEDLECSATWTLNRLVKKGYTKNFYGAIWSHNGYGINKNYVPKVLRLGKAQWDSPLTLVTADEQRQVALK